MLAEIQMTREELIARMQAREDNFVERKSDGVKPQDIRKTASAFANTVEGREAVLFIGVDDKPGAAAGVQNVEKLQGRVRDACQGDCYPPIKYTTEVLTIEGKDVLAVIIPPSDSKPHFTGPAFVRVGSESAKASPQQFEELILSRIDRCREILRYRNKGLISVWAIGCRLRDGLAEANPRYRERAECLVKNCTAHLVTLEQPATGSTYSLPLDRFEIGHDPEKNRPLLMMYRRK